MGGLVRPVQGNRVKVPPLRRTRRAADSSRDEPDAIGPRVEGLMARLRCDLQFVALDVALLSAAYLVGLILRLDGRVSPHYWLRFRGFLPAAILVHLGANWAC